MADKVTNTDELWVELSDASGQYTRTLQIENPDTSTYTTVALVQAALAPLFPTADGQSTGTVVPFFYDDNNPEIGLTKVASVQRVTTTKTVRQYSND